MVTGAWILLSCILGLRHRKNTNFLFFPSNFQFFYFHIDEQYGLSYLALMNRFGKLKMR